MNHERVLIAATSAAALLAAAAFLPSGNALAAAAMLALGAAWLTAWRRGSDALVHLGLAGVLGGAAIGGAWGAAVPAVLSAGAALLAWDAMRAERRLRPFANILDQTASTQRRMRTVIVVAAVGALAGLTTLLLRTLAPAGAVSFGALSALLAASVVLVAAAIRFTSPQ